MAHGSTAELVAPRRAGVAMPSFDVVSELNAHEVTNAVDQANRELAQRFDFKDTGARFELEQLVVTLRAQVDFQLKQMLEILKLRLAKRGIDVACIDAQEPEIALSAATQKVTLRHGIDPDAAKRISRLVKDSKLKVQASIQGEKVRITGKQRDDLQAAIQLLRKADLGLPLQFDNFRD
jgi:cyclic-di-GMP-binding protein